MLKRRLVPARFSRPGVRFLIFHHIRPDEEASFTRLVDYLLSRGQLGAPADAQRRELNRVVYVLSFDDGFGSNYEIARRILEPRGVQAVFFVCPAFVGEPDVERVVSEFVIPGVDLPADMVRELRFMTWDEVNALAAAGHTIGSHAMHHRRLSEVTLVELQDEIVASQTLLGEKLQRPVEWFAFPFGDLESINAAALAVIHETYRYCCSGIRGLNPAGTERRDYFRDHVDLAAPWSYQLMAAEGGLDFAYAAARKQFDVLASGNGSGTKVGANG